MKSEKVMHWLIFLALGAAALMVAAVEGPPRPETDGIESVSGSYVYLNNIISPDHCSIRDKEQTFCFQANSFTNDWDYIYYLWMRFPSDWTINNVYVQDTPYCANGGTFAPFSFWNPAANEARINHTRYQANPTDTCSAFYCFQVTTGGNNPGVNYATVSWYWVSSGYGSPPFHPCSSDGYTPTGQPACDESTTPPVIIDPCPRVFLPVVKR